MLENNQNLELSKGNETEVKLKRGFAAMDEHKRREIASKGGKAAHQQGVAHRFDSEEAKAAGRKGGLASSKKKGVQMETEMQDEISQERYTETNNLYRA